MSESGSSLLRLIQNNETPLLDLLVRESIQNSLDAAKGGGTQVRIDFKTGSFEPLLLNKHLEGITKPLNEKYGAIGNKCKFLEIRDSNTTGLTGPSSYKDVKKDNNGVNIYGNLLKLVYEICKPQLEEGAGGSWGLGKTIYFRLGIGLVIYYTRILENNQYKSKLAACFVEDENSLNAILPCKGEISRGIAWWGKVQQDGKSIPTENEIEINQILDVFGIQPYKNETGTTVIIPYLDEEKLLSEVYPKNETTQQSGRPYWTNSVPEYLKIAVQRWYAPRINNSKYPYGSFFKAYINGKKIETEKMLPLFRIARELYIFATGTTPEDSFLKDIKAEPFVESIKTRGSFKSDTTAGTIAYVKLNKEQLCMLPPANQYSPYHQIDNYYDENRESNPPIVLFTRKPGMIVGYDYNSTWTHGMIKTVSEEYIIGIFVANSYNVFAGNEKLTLDEYIRKGEKADHTSWSDHNAEGVNRKIVNLIQQQVCRKVNQKFESNVYDNTIRKPVGLSRALADILLPSSAFGRLPKHQKTASEKPKPLEGKKDDTNPVSPVISGTRATSFKTGTPLFSERGITVPFSLYAKDTSTVRIEAFLNTDFKKYNSSLWESEDGVGEAFPLSFTEFRITDITENKQKADLTKIDLQIDTRILACQSSYAGFEFKKDSISKKPVVIEFTPKKEKLLFRGVLSFVTEDHSVKWTIDLSK